MTPTAYQYIRALEAENTARAQGDAADIERKVAATATARAALVAEQHGVPPEAQSAPEQGLRYLTINGETICIITLYGTNRHAEVTEWHRRVMVEHWGLPVNYVQCPFPGVSHGSCMNQVLAQTLGGLTPPDYYLWCDNDNVMLRREAIVLAYQQARDKVTVWGHLWCSNHKKGPNGTTHHPYASQACLLFSRDLYNRLGRPDMDHWVPRSDTAEELTYAAKAGGYNVSLLYPSFSVQADTPGDNGVFYGMGNTYGPLYRPLWHHTSYTGNPRHVEVFTETCKMIVAGAFEGDTPALPYGYQPPN